MAHTLAPNQFSLRTLLLWGVGPSISPDQLRALLTVDGGEETTRDLLVKRGFLRRA